MSSSYFSCSSRMKHILAKWLLLWLRARKVPILEDDEIIEFLLRGNTSSPALLHKMKHNLADEHLKMMNLGYDWLNSYLPFVYRRSIVYILVC